MNMKSRTLMAVSLSLVLAAFLAPSSAAQGCQVPASVVALGDGTPGVNGVPTLATNGPPIAGAPGFGLQVAQGAPNALCFVLIGNTAGTQAVPSLGGTVFLAAPFHHPRLQLDAQGAAFLAMPQVQDMPAFFCGLTLHAQAMIADAAAQGGGSLSNAITITFGV
jgi:hypothetical protein